MKPVVLVLLFASSALAAPSVQLTQYTTNEIPPTRDNGKPVSSFLTDRLFDLLDGGDTNIHILNSAQVINDLANSGDKSSQALALGQTLAIISELAAGIPGDACASAAVVNAYAAAVRSGNLSGFRSALSNYVKYLGSNLNYIVKLAKNPNSVRFATGPSGGCVGGGRSYDFETVWDAIRSEISNSLVNEQYCVAKRMYGAFNARSNNVGAAATAASLPPVVRVFEYALGPVSSFLRIIAKGGNPSQAVGNVRSALAEGASKIRL